MRDLGWDLMSQGQLDGALEELVLDVATYPNSSEAHSMLAEVYNRSGEREQALESRRTALELDPDNAQAASPMAQISWQEPAAADTENDG